MSFTVGQVVYVTHHYMREAPSRRVTVEKVGRKYVYVSNSRTPYDRDTGREVSEYSGHTSIRSVEQYERDAANTRASDVLRWKGVELSGMARLRAVEIYEALKDICP